MNRNYSVFLSHAGPDKESIAIPLYDRLRQKNISAFVDREELHVGDNGPRVMEYAMNTAPVGIFILSPEFAARNWTMAELICFQKREQDALKDNRPLPILIPVFYRLDIATCRNEKSLFHTQNEGGENAFLAETFFERAAGDKISVAEVARAMKQVSMRTGIENHGKVNNAVTSHMKALRSAFVAQIVDEIQGAVSKAKASGAEDDAVQFWRAMAHTPKGTHAGARGTLSTAHVGLDSFAPYFEVWENPRYVVFGNESVCSEGAQNSKAKARGILLNEEIEGPVVLAIQGMPGVGKTCTMRALCHDRDIRNRFKDGVYVIRLGANAVLHTFLAGLRSVVEESGGHHLAASIGQCRSLEPAITSAKKWFVNRSCLFLLDDVWSRPVDGSEYLNGLSRICAAGTGSAIIFSTREKKLLVHNTVTHEFQLFAHRPRSGICRTILLQGCTGDRKSILLPVTNLAVTGLLDFCCGLPAALAVTGRSVRKLAIDMGRDYDRAIQAYYNMNGNDVSKVIDGRGDIYSSLSVAIMMSVSVLEHTKDTRRGTPFRFPHNEMLGGLCVLKKQQWAPLSMLRCLWDMPSIQDTNVVTDQFSEVGLIDVQFRKVAGNEMKGIQLHDLVHDVATRNAKKVGNEKTWHARLLHAYSSVDGNNVRVQDETREWWATERDVNAYFDENLVRHLMAAGDTREAFLLVTRPQWIARHLASCGILSFERDIEMLQVAFETFSDSAIDRKDMVEAFRLIQNCVRAGLSAILSNPREVYFQIYARMMYTKESSTFANSIVQYAERNAVKPCLKTVSVCAQQAETVSGRRVSCPEAICVQVVEDLGLVLTGCSGGKLVVFDMETCELKAEWKAHADWVKFLAVTPNNKLLVSGSGDKSAKVWDMANEFIPIAVCKFPSSVECVHITPDNLRLVVGDVRGTVSIWHLETGLCTVPKLGRHGRGVRSVSVSWDGAIFASGDELGVIKVWEIDAGTVTESVLPSESGSATVPAKFLGKRRRNEDEHASSDRNALAVLEGHTGWIRAIRFTKDGRKLLSGSHDKTVRVWDVRRGCQIGTAFCDHTDWVRSVFWSADEKRIISVGEDRAMCAWSVGGNLERRVQFAQEGVWVHDAKISSDGGQVVWCGGGWIQITDVRRDLSAHVPGTRHRGGVTAMSISPDGTRLITGSWDRTLVIWDTATGRQVGRTISGQKYLVKDIAITPDGQQFVFVSLDRSVRVMDIKTQKQLAVLEGHSDSVTSVEISLDGKTVITGSKDETVRIWDLDACDCTHQVLEGHSMRVECLYLSRDGLHFVSLSHSEAIQWDMERAEMVMRIEKETAHRMSVDEIEDLFRVPILSRLRIGDARLGRMRNKITCVHNGLELVLATLDSNIELLDFSSASMTLCVGLESGHVGIFRFEPENNGDFDAVEIES